MAPSSRLLGHHEKMHDFGHHYHPEDHWSCPLQFCTSVNPGWMLLREAVGAHSTIGWMNVFKGRVATNLKDYMTAHIWSKLLPIKSK
jgi:hypothetical protein